MPTIDFYDTPAKRKKLMQAYCQHLAGGFTRASFTGCTWSTFEALAKNFPEDFPADELEVAVAAQNKQWETRLLAHAEDRAAGNPAATIFALKNVAGWQDRHQVDHKGQINFADMITSIDPDPKSPPKKDTLRAKKVKKRTSPAQETK